MSDDSKPTETFNAPTGNGPNGNGKGGKPASNRGPMFMIFGGVVVLAGVAWGAYTLIEGGKSVSTDNAYVNASAAQITPQIAAPVVEADINDTKLVHKGDVLVVLDDSDAKLALAAAQANLAQVQRQVGTYYTNDATLKAQEDASAAQIQNAQANLEKAQKAYDDRKALAGTGAVSGEDVTTAKAALDQAVAAVATARAQAQAASGNRASNAALIPDVSATQNPQVKAAQIRVDQAQLDLDRTVIRAPISGVIARNTVQVGQRVQVGQVLMSVVPIDSAYVDANFKEVQLKKVHVNQPVVMTADVYGSSVKFHGRVQGLSGGTGSAFSIIPAQNATGNWIKVVQRLPVRITLDPQELKTHPLRVGESMTAKIDVTQ
jgi:membrane fusion protein (multidrug efflux system)